MARNKGTFGAAFNFEVKMQGALDPRVVVDTKSELINKETWPYNGDTIYLYEGLIVAVKADKAMYMLVDLSKVTAADYSGWKQLDVSAAQVVEIIDNLTSTSTTAALSANQGKQLNDKITELNTKLSAIYSYRGSKATFEELPADAQAGDVWNVEAAHGNFPPGTNYAWTGTEWDGLGGSIDLSAYQTIAAADAKYAVKSATGIDLADGEVLKGTKADGTKLDLVQVAADAVKVGDSTGALKLEGANDRPSYDKNGVDQGQLALLKDVTDGDAAGLQSAKDYADQKVAAIDLTGFVSKETGKELIPTEKLTLIDTNKSNIDAANADITANAGKITALETALPNYVKVVPGAKADQLVTKISEVVTDGEKVDLKLEVVTRDATDKTYKHGAEDVLLTVPKVTTTKAGVMSAADKVALDNVVAKANNNETAIGTASGKITALETRATTNEGKITALETRATGIEADVATNEAGIAAVKSTADAAAAAITTLNGDATVEGSVKKTAKTIADASAAAAVEAGLSWVEVTA